MRKLAALALTCLAFTLTLACQHTPIQSSADIPSARLLDEPTRRVLKLPNGFTILLQQSRTAPIVATRIYIRAGAITEQQHMGAGISHVLEHLVAGAGTSKNKESEIATLLQEMGNDTNAYTDADHTCYFITTTADKFASAMNLLIDFTTDASFTKEQFQREYEVVQRELEMGEAETDRTFLLNALANRYMVHPARHPVVGYKSAFQKLTREDLIAYYKQMYIPDNMIISVAGDIDLDAAEKLITNRLKNIPRKTVPLITIPEEPPVLSPRLRVARADVKQSRVDWAFPTVNLYHADLYATDLLANILGGSESSLLVRKLRDDLGLVAGIECHNPTPSYVEGNLAVTAVLAADKIPAAQTAVLAVLDDVLKNGVTPDALARAKAQAVANMVYGNQTALQQATQNGIDFLAAGNIDFTTQYVKRLQQVTPEQVQAVAQRYLRPEKMITTALLPLNEKDPFAATAAATTAAETSQVKKITLRNGITLLVSRNTSAPIVSFNLYALGGLLAETEATNGTGAAMMQLLTRGTTSRSYEQITDFLDGTGTTLSTESGNNSFSIAMLALKDKAPDAAALFADIALNPSLAPAQLDQIRQPLIAAVDTAAEDWYGEAYKATREAFYANSPYRRMPEGSKEILAKITVEQIRTHYQKFFLNPQKMVIAIAGDIDEAAAQRWAAPFETIPARPPESGINLTSTPAPAAAHTLKSDKQSATIMFAFPPGITANSPDRFALTVLQTHLGGYMSPFGSVLHDTLRGKGLVYAVQASNMAGAANAMFLIYALGEPEHAPAIIENIQKIVDDLKAGKITDQQLEMAKIQTITGELLSKQTIAEKSSNEALDELLGLGFDEDQRFPQAVRAVTKQQVIEAARKYLNAPIIVTLTPRAGL